MNVFYALERYEQPHTEQASSFGKSALSFSFSFSFSLSLVVLAPMTFTVSSMVPCLPFPRVQYERDTFAMMAARESVFNDQLEGIRTFRVRDGRVFGAPPSQVVGAGQAGPAGHMDGGRDDGVGTNDGMDDGLGTSDPSEVSMELEDLLTASDSDNDDLESA